MTTPYTIQYNNKIPQIHQAKIAFDNLDFESPIKWLSEHTNKLLIPILFIKNLKILNIFFCGL